MACERILIVDDEEDILDLLEYNLVKNGYHVQRATRGEDAMSAARLDPPDLILLDLMLPGLNGLEVCRLLKGDARTTGIPIVMVTAKREEEDVAAGLDVGADDYITKPFSPRVLIARIRAALRRKSTLAMPEDLEITVGELNINPHSHRVRLAGQRVELTLTQFRILQLLASKPGWVFTRAQIVGDILGPDVVLTDRSIDIHIGVLRRRLGDYCVLIETVRGVGYRLREDGLRKCGG